VYAVDRDRRVRYLSPRAAELLGVPAEQAIGAFCGDLLRPFEIEGERPCEVACPILQARFRGPVRATEHLDTPAGSRRVVLSSSPPAGGLQVQILREETAVEAARRARDAVVADLAHELKTPLAAQRASLELLAERLSAADPDAARLAAGIETGILRLERLIENLLESVRIESGELGIRREPVELDEVVEEAIGTTAPLAAKRGQRIEVDLPFPLPPLVGDPQRLVQVLVNLLANASKFSPAGSEIRLTGEIGGGAVRLWVEDEGPGFEPDELDRRSERFRRSADGTSEPREPGSGLGLWIARSIAERHGGSLAVERRLGRTRVGLSLPAGESAP
jgi:signal transduction histidine kinase